MRKILFLVTLVITIFYQGQNFTIEELILLRTTPIEEFGRTLSSNNWVYKTGKPSSEKEFGHMTFEKKLKTETIVELNLDFKIEKENILTITTKDLSFYNENLDNVKTLQPELIFSVPMEHQFMTAYNARKTVFVFTISTSVNIEDQLISKYILQIFDIDDFMKRYIKKEL